MAFLAVYREGAETALFYQALFNEGSHVVLPISLGILVGAVALAVIFTLFYRFGVRIPLRPFFSVTSVLLYCMALVFMGKGIRELQEGNAVSITMIQGLPTVDALGFYPTWETIGAQVLLLVLFAFAVARRSGRSDPLPCPPSYPTARRRTTALVRRSPRCAPRTRSCRRGSRLSSNRLAPMSIDALFAPCARVPPRSGSPRQSAKSDLYPRLELLEADGAAIQPGPRSRRNLPINPRPRSTRRSSRQDDGDARRRDRQRDHERCSDRSRIAGGRPSRGRTRR